MGEVGVHREDVGALRFREPPYNRVAVAGLFFVNVGGACAVYDTFGPVLRVAVNDQNLIARRNFFQGLFQPRKQPVEVWTFVYSGNDDREVERVFLE